MDAFEEAVMYCLVANGETFVAPQFDVGKGWSRPDFVAIRPAKKTVYIVEVSTAGSLSDMARKINNRAVQWVSPVRDQLLQSSTTGEDWTFQVLAFVRRDQIEWLKAKVTLPAPDVTLLTVEDAISHWQWNDSMRTARHEFGDHPMGRFTAI